MVAIQELNPGNQWNPSNSRTWSLRWVPSGWLRCCQGGHMGGSGQLWILMGKQCDKHIGITPLIGGISNYIQLYPLYPRCSLTQTHFASQAFHKSGVLPRDNAVTKISAPWRWGRWGQWGQWQVLAAATAWGLRHWKPLKLDGFIYTHRIHVWYIW